MIFGIILGLIWMLVKVGLTTAQGTSWIFQWLRPQDPRDTRKTERRLRRIFFLGRPMFSVRMFRPLWSMLPVALFFLMTGPDNAYWTFIWGFFLGYCGPLVLGFGLGMFKKYYVKIAAYAAREAAHRLSPAKAEALLIPYARSAKGNYKRGVIPALRSLGTPKAIAALNELAAASKDVAVVQEAQKALIDLNHIWNGKLEPVSIAPIYDLKVEHAGLLMKLVKSQRLDQEVADRERMDEVIRLMDELVFGQLPHRRAFPYTYCKRCHARGEMQEYQGWQWVLCRKCKDVTALHAGVQTVIGQIGGDTEWTLSDGQLKINLWDDVHHKPLVADIDALEIVGGKSIDYNWAVSAIVEHLHKHSAEATAKLPVQLTDNPSLDANSERLLRTLEEVERSV